jgi:hypothetical protein
MILRQREIQYGHFNPRITWKPYNCERDRTHFVEIEP